MSKVITPDDLKTFKGGTALKGGIATQVCDAVNTYIEQATGRSWGEEEEVTERAHSGRSVWLSHMDVKTITSIKTGYPNETQNTVNASDYYVTENGRIEFTGGAYVSRSIANYLEIVYTHGVAADKIPQDLKLAALSLAAQFYNWATNNQQEIVASSVGSYRLQYAGSVRGSNVADRSKNTADAMWSIIDSYRLRRV